jgi:hypothetical protein
MVQLRSSTQHHRESTPRFSDSHSRPVSTTRSPSPSAATASSPRSWDGPRWLVLTYHDLWLGQRNLIESWSGWHSGFLGLTLETVLHDQPVAIFWSFGGYLSLNQGQACPHHHGNSVLKFTTVIILSLGSQECPKRWKTQSPSPKIVRGHCFLSHPDECWSLPSSSFHIDPAEQWVWRFVSTQKEKNINYSKKNGIQQWIIHSKIDDVQGQAMKLLHRNSLHRTQVLVCTLHTGDLLSVGGSQKVRISRWKRWWFHHISPRKSREI